MNIVSTMVGLSIMGAAAPSMMTMSIAPFEAQKRAQNLGVAESAAVIFAAANEGQTQLTGSTPLGCEVNEIGTLAYDVTCTEGEGTKYAKSVTRAFRLAAQDLSCDDNDGNNGHGNSNGDDCSNPGGGYANNVRVFDFPKPELFSRLQCPVGDEWGVYGYNEANYERDGGACTPHAVWAPVYYEASKPKDWLYDVNNWNGWGDHDKY